MVKTRPVTPRPASRLRTPGSGRLEVDAHKARRYRDGRGKKARSQIGAFCGGRGADDSVAIGDIVVAEGKCGRAPHADVAALLAVVGVEGGIEKVLDAAEIEGDRWLNSVPSDPFIGRAV